MGGGGLRFGPEFLHLKDTHTQTESSTAETMAVSRLCLPVPLASPIPCPNNYKR